MSGESGWQVQEDRGKVGERTLPSLGSRRDKKVGGRTKRIVVKASPEENEQLGLAAAARGVSVPRLLVETTLRDRPHDGDDSGHWIAMDDQKFVALVGELRQVLQVLGPTGNNLNQIARVANAGGGIESGVEPAAERVQQLAGRIRRVLDDVEDARS